MNGNSPNWEGLTVAEALRSAGADFDEVVFIDEPPGKLRALSFRYEGKDFRGRVVLEIEYQPELFSSERKWPRPVVESQKVTRVTWEPDSGEN